MTCRTCIPTTILFYFISILGRSHCNTHTHTPMHREEGKRKKKQAKEYHLRCCFFSFVCVAARSYTIDKKRNETECSTLAFGKHKHTTHAAITTTTTAIMPRWTWRRRTGRKRDRVKISTLFGWIWCLSFSCIVLVAQDFHKYILYFFHSLSTSSLLLLLFYFPFYFFRSFRSSLNACVVIPTMCLIITAKNIFLWCIGCLILLI